MSLMNEILDQVKVQITANTNKTCNWIENIGETTELEVKPTPPIKNLEECMNDLQVAMAKKMTEMALTEALASRHDFHKLK